MRTNPLLLLLLASPLACAGGGGDGALPADLTVLVPADAVTLIQVRSLAELAERAEQIRAVLDADGTPVTARRLATDLLLSSGFSDDAAALLDTRRPIAAALTTAAGAAIPFRRVLLLPARDAEDLATVLRKNWEGLETAIEGGYVAAHLDGAPRSAAGTSALLVGLPDGLVSVRADLGALVEQFGPLAEIGLNLVEGEMRDDSAGGGAEMVPPIMDFLRDLLKSADLATLVVETDGEDLALEAALTLQPGSPLAGLARTARLELGEWLRRLDPEAAVSFVKSAGHGGIMSNNGEIYEELLAEAQGDEDLPPEASAALGAYLNGMREISIGMDRISSGSFDYGAGGLRGAFTIQANSPTALRTILVDFLHAPELAALGFVGTAPETTEFAGLQAIAWSQRLDLAAWVRTLAVESPEIAGREVGRILSAWLGEEQSLQLIAACDADRLHLLFGGDDAWRRSMADRMVAGGDPPAHLERLAAKLEGADPGTILSLDLGFCLDLLQPLLGAVEQEPSVERTFQRMRDAAGDEPLRCDAYWGATANDLRAGMSLELTRLMRMIAAAEPR